MEMGEELQEILTRDDATIQQQSVTDPYTDFDIIRAAHMVILPAGAFAPTCSLGIQLILN